VIGSLDSVSGVLHEDSKINAKAKSKLSEGLVKKEMKAQSQAQQGVMEAAEEDVCGILNDALASPVMFRLFRGCDDASVAVEIARVKLSADYSHSIAYWTSPIVDKFLILVMDQEGIEKGLQTRRKMSKYITEKLQKREGAFRTYLIKNMDFRKVPRIEFRSEVE
jgi:ribosome-binding factor A